ncbi:hypothetical protein GCM10022236_45670 [Microlunatus ginsengisoli]|uniref:Integrase catalytic domain-containing protein n=1 Tax=Microlunatus ginsengisoli TaxID=363863 RepID=A0ABP7ARC5_9ACTN
MERFHGTFRPEITELGPFVSLIAAQAAVDAWVANYNAERPHQALDPKVPVVPADRFAPADPGGLELWLPTTLEIVAVSSAEPDRSVDPNPSPVTVVPRPGGPVELDLVVPPSGNMWLRRQQFWLGPARAGQLVRFWIDCDWVHLSIGGRRVKSLRSRFSTADLDALAVKGAVPAGPPPLASHGGPGSRSHRTIFEVERTVANNGMVSLGKRVVLAAWMLAGRRVGIYIEEGCPLLFFDPETRELLRTRPNPLEPGEAALLQRGRPPGPVPRRRPNRSPRNAAPPTPG